MSNKAVLQEIRINEAEVFEQIDKISNPTVIDMNGLTIYSGNHEEYGNCRLIVTAFAEAVLYFAK